ncbi:MAG: ATP-binding protein, partial [Terriglobales bacterium]
MRANRQTVEWLMASNGVGQLLGVLGIPASGLLPRESEKGVLVGRNGGQGERPALRKSGQAMHISEIHIKNLRLFRNEVVNFGDYTCLVGPNGAGKSTVLTALNIFFRESADLSTNVLNLDREDFYNKDVSQPIEITVTFEGLSPDAESDFAAYFRHGKLIITVTVEWNEKTGTATAAQKGQRLAMKAFAPFFEALNDGALVPALRDKYAPIKSVFADLPDASTKPAMTEALQKYEAEHPKLKELLPSPDEFYGFSKGKNRLEKYVQWVFVPAVKDAATEQMETKKAALGLLLERTVRAKVSFDEPLQKIKQAAIDSYQELLVQNESILTSISETLGARLQEWSHPEASCRVRWHSDPLKAVTIASPLAELLASEGAFEGAISKFGHGLQRSLLLTLLHELANTKDQGPKLILGCEEPELYQHPPQARHLASVLQKLSTQNAQIIVTTHSPLYVRSEHFQDVRLVRRDPVNRCATVQRVFLDKLARRIAAASGDAPANPTGTQIKVSQQLQPMLSEMFFTTVLVLVEGEEDMAYITAYVHLTGRFDEFRRLGIHIVPTSNKSNMIRPLA